MQDSDGQQQLQDVVAAQQKLLAQAAVLLQHQQQQHQAHLAQLQQTGAALRDGTQALMREVVQTLGAQGRHALHEGMGDAAAQFRQQLDGSLAQAREVLLRLAENTERASSVQAGLVWKGLAALLTGSLLAVAGTWLFAHAQFAQIDRQRVEAQYLEAFNRADVVLCGEHLCANIDAAAPAQGADGRYRPIRPR